jgi:hypothetical protein
MRGWQSLDNKRGRVMLKAIYFALHFAMIFLGVVLAIHFDFWLGVAIAITFIIKWFLMFPQVEGRDV